MQAFFDAQSIWFYLTLAALLPYLVLFVGFSHECDAFQKSMQDRAQSFASWSTNLPRNQSRRLADVMVFLAGKARATSLLAKYLARLEFFILGLVILDRANDGVKELIRTGNWKDALGFNSLSFIAVICVLGLYVVRLQISRAHRG